MTDIVFGARRTDYDVQATWGSRAETAGALADRFVRQIDALTAIDPLFDLWTCGAKKPTKFETVRDHYVDEVKARIAKDDWGVPDPTYGYYIGARTRGRPLQLSYTLSVHAGSTSAIGPYLDNSLLLETSAGVVPDPAAITYRIFKSTLLSVVAIWDPVECVAYPSVLLPPYGTPRESFMEVWIQYLSAPLARLITPPDTAIVEHLENGGMLMAATAETFRADNPAHRSVARDIAAATAPLNRISLNSLD